jgi:hypothetical protein
MATGVNGIQAIETHYHGYRFRSRLEARWAVALDHLGVRWEYEQQGYDLNGVRYLPDFWLPDQETFVEIKPGPEPPLWHVYLAGKMTNWRNGVDLGGHIRCGPGEDDHTQSCHGRDENGMAEADIVESCLDGIGRADRFLAWIDAEDCHGTLVEIGVAKQRGLPIDVGWDCDLYARLLAAGKNEGSFRTDGDWHCPEPRQAMWFAETCADKSGIYGTAADFVRATLPLTPAEEKCRALSRLHPCFLVYGSPWPDEYGVMWFLGQDSLRGRRLDVRAEGGGPPQLCTDWKTGRAVLDAFAAARSARFEHGEAPR